jgi:hypothetical protein
VLTTEGKLPATSNKRTDLLAGFSRAVDGSFATSGQAFWLEFSGRGERQERQARATSGQTFWLEESDKRTDLLAGVHPTHPRGTADKRTKPTGGQTFWLVFSASRQVDRPFPRTFWLESDKRTDLLAGGERQADRPSGWSSSYPPTRNSRQADKADRWTDLLAGVFSKPTGGQTFSTHILARREADRWTDLLAGVFSGRAFEV